MPRTTQREIRLLTDQITSYTGKTYSTETWAPGDRSGRRYRLVRPAGAGYREIGPAFYGAAAYAAALGLALEILAELRRA